MWLIFVAVCLLGWLWFRRGGRLSHFPGPKGWPVLGNLTQIDFRTAHITFSKWAKQYGGVYKVKLFTEEVLVVTGSKEVNEVLVSKGQDFAGRPTAYRTDVFSEYGYDLAFTQPNASRKKLRKTSHAAIKQYDKGLVRIEEFALQATRDMLDEFAAYKEAAFDPKPHIYLATMNITTLFLIGQIFKAESEMFKVFTEFEQAAMVLLSPISEGAILDLFPWLRFVNKSLAHSAFKYRPLRNKLCDFLKKENVKTESEGFYDSYLSVLSKAIEESDDLTPVQLNLGLANIILGGTSTTTNHLYCFLNLMVHYPKVQERLQLEIDDVLGSRQVSIADRDTMPIFSAAIFELLRYASLLALGVPHATTKNTDINGLKVPSGTTVFTNQFGLHHDENYFPDPWVFEPERYLDEEGNLVPADHPNRKRLFPFGAGPRVCFGETFAKVRMFLILVSILQKFKISADNENELVSCDPRRFSVGIILQPLCYRIRLTNRS